MDSAPLFTLGKVIDAQVDAAPITSAYHDFVEGSAAINYVPFNATAFSSSELNFMIQPPGLSVYTSRRMVLSATLGLAVDVSKILSATDVNGQPLFAAGRGFTMPAYPMNTLFQSGQVQINSVVINTPISQVMAATKRCLGENAQCDTCPTQPDVTGNNNSSPPGSLSMASAGSAFGTTWGENGNGSCVRVAGFYTDNTFSTLMTAGAGAGNITWAVRNGMVVPTLTAAGTAVAATTFFVAFECMEPLLVDPFTTSVDAPGFINTSQIQIRLPMLTMGLSETRSRIIRTWSTCAFGESVPTSPASYVKVSDVRYGASAIGGCWLRTPRLTAQFLSPGEGSSVPSRAIYPFNSWTPFQTTISSTIAANASAQVVNLPLQTLATCPDYLAFWIEMPAGVAADPLSRFDQNDLFACITGINVTWNNQSGLLNTVPPYELWAISRRNGVNLPMSECVPIIRSDNTAWSAGLSDGGASSNSGSQGLTPLGGVVLLRINKDLPTAPGSAGGVAGNYTYSAAITFANPSANSQVGKAVAFSAAIYTQYLVLRAGGNAEVIPSVANEATEFETGVAPERTLQALKNLDLAVGAGVSGAGSGNHTSRLATRSMSKAASLGSKSDDGAMSGGGIMDMLSKRRRA